MGESDNGFPGRLTDTLFQLRHSELVYAGQLGKPLLGQVAAVSKLLQAASERRQIALGHCHLVLSGWQEHSQE
jgi:hypothetical protein